MPRVPSLLPRALASLTVIAVLGAAAWAQQAPTVRVRGTIEAVDGPLLAVKSREGADLKVRVTDNVAVFGVASIAMSSVSHKEKLARTQASKITSGLPVIPDWGSARAHRGPPD